jgi:DNA-binding CsgD family transcriptional regulator
MTDKNGNQLQNNQKRSGENKITLNRPRASSSRHPAFVFYYPQDRKNRGHIFYNEEAWHILSLKVPPLKQNGVSSPDIYGVCSKWKRLLDKAINRGSGSVDKEAADPNFIENFQSYRRQYVVRGIVLSDAPPDTQNKRSYLFVMERMDQDRSHLARAARQLNLNRREQEIVRLLVGGLGNKEIAFALGLSLNTVKGYMKLLMGKLGVRNRLGIISILLAQNSDFHPFPQPLQIISPPSEIA